MEEDIEQEELKQEVIEESNFMDVLNDIVEPFKIGTKEK